VPPRVADAVERAMAKDPAARFPSMDDFVAELDACREELSQPGEASTLVATAPPQRLPARRRRSLGPVVLIGLGLLLLGAVVAAVIFRDDIGPDGARGSQAITLSAVASYDPQGDDGVEHPAEVPLATDGDDATYWPTSTYNDFSSLKEGVGIVLDARESVSPSRLVVVSDKPGFTAEIRTGDSAEGPFEEVASPQRLAASRTIFPVEDAEARYWLVWITDLDGFAHVNEVTAR
jgi:putative peptidoglycan lipid II flippase